MKAELWEGCSSTWLKGLNKAELSDVGAKGLAAPGFITEGADTPVTFKARNPQRSEAYKMRWSSGACSRIRLNTYLTGLMLWKKRFCPSLLSKNSVSSVEQPWVFPQTASCLFSLTTLHITFWEELCVFFLLSEGGPDFVFFLPGFWLSLTGSWQTEQLVLPVSHTSGRKVTQDRCDYVDSLFSAPISSFIPLLLCTRGTCHSLPDADLIRGPVTRVPACLRNAKLLHDVVYIFQLQHRRLTLVNILPGKPHQTLVLLPARWFYSGSN